MKLDELQSLIESNRFHHATYRNLGTLWEGLYIYARDDSQDWIGYRLVDCFNAREQPSELRSAEDMIRQQTTGGIAVGSFR